MVSTSRMCSTQARRRAGLKVSPGRLLQDQLVEREVGNGFAQARILGLHLLHALDLARLQPAVLLAPAVIRDLGHPDGADRVRHRGSLCDQHIDLAQLGHDLFGGMSLLAHRDPPSACKPYFRADHFKGGGSLRSVVLMTALVSLALPALARGELSETQKRKALLPAVRATTECIAQEILRSPTALSYARQNKWF